MSAIQLNVFLPSRPSIRNFGGRQRSVSSGEVMKARRPGNPIARRVDPHVTLATSVRRP